MDKLLTVEQVAGVLGMHVKTLQKRLRANEINLSYVQVSPRNIGFRPSVVERYIEMHEVRLDGTGLKRRASRKKKLSPVFMTDEQAQEFFKDIARDEDGAIITS
jgi:hypothetical protein